MKKMPIGALVHGRSTGDPAACGPTRREAKRRRADAWLAPLIAITAALTGAGAFAAPGVNPVSTEQVSMSEEETLRALMESERLAILSRDIPALERFWSDRVTVNAPTNRVNAGRRAVMDAAVHSGVINYSTFERTIEFFCIDGDYAFIMGGEVVTRADNGQTMHRRYTNVWKKENGTWRLFARHANIAPSLQ